MSKTVNRFDFSEVRGAEKTSQGYLRAPAYATRTGVFKYRRADGSLLRELRLPDEVFKGESMRTLAGVPLTNDHPSSILLDSQNTKNFMIGFTGETVERENNFLKTSITITDAEVIDQISVGKRQLSCGYTCELEEKSGNFDGEDYDVIQRNIRYNHLALVRHGRAGSEVRIKLDQDDAMLDENSKESIQDNKNGGAEMQKITIDGKEFEVSKELKEAFDAYMGKTKEKNDESEKTLADKAKEVDSVSAKLDSANEQITKLNSKVEALEKAKADSISKEEISKLVKERVRIEKVAAKFGVTNLDVCDTELKKAVILADSKNANLEGKSETYIDARFDAVCENMTEVEDKKEDLGKGITESRKESTKLDSLKAREAAMNRASQLWTKDLNVKA